MISQFNAYHPLWIALKENHLGKVWSILSQNLSQKIFDINHFTDEGGQSPLHKAAEFNCVDECLLALITNGANVNLQDKSQNTPLHLAAKAGHYTPIILLLENGASKTLRNYKYETPEEVAYNEGRYRIANHIKNFGLTVQMDKELPAAMNITSEEKPEEKSEEIPQSFLCQISFEVMKDPVLTPNGNSYEKTAITDWIKKSGKDPITGKDLTIDQLIPNLGLKNAIEEWQDKQKTNKKRKKF